MREVRKPIKILAVFEPGKPPRPYKFKLTDERKDEHTIIVDEITFTDTRAIKFIAYECVSYYGQTSRRYVLRYYKDTCAWELFKTE